MVRTFSEPNSVGSKRRQCDECGKNNSNVMLREKLDPKNLRPTVRKLCSDCSRSLGFQALNMGTSHPMSVPGVD